MEISDILLTLATKADIEAVRGDLREISERMSHLATKADIADLYVGLVKWIAVTMITSNATAFSIAKFAG